MKRTKNTITIVFLCITLFFGGILFFLNIGTSNTNVNKIAKSINYTKYIKESKRINAVLEDKKIPIEIFNYIDKNKLEKMIEDNTYSKKKVTNILVESINKYEDEYEVSVYDYIPKEIDEISSIITNKIKDIYEIYEGVRSISRNQYIFLIIELLLTAFLIIKKEFVRTGVSYLVIAVGSYYMIRTYLRTSLKDFMNNTMEKIIVDNLTKVYTIYLCIGIILLLIYFILWIKEVRDKSKDWR